jgi:hypothetical protein
MINKRFYNEVGIDYLIIDSEILDECVAFIKECHYIDILVDSSDGFLLDNLSFFSSCNWVENLILVDREFKINKKGIEHLKNLKRLRTDINIVEKVDLKLFKHLKFLSIDFHKNWQNVDSIENLLELQIWKAPQDFLLNSNLKNLEILSLKQSRIVHLEGISNMKKLRELELVGLSKLRVLKFDGEMRCLNRLYIESCNSISEISGFENLPNIKFIIFSNCKKIPSCKFLNNLRSNNIRVVFSYTKILDGSEDLIKKFEEHTYYYGKNSFSNFDKL